MGCGSSSQDAVGHPKGRNDIKPLQGTLEGQGYGDAEKTDSSPVHRLREDDTEIDEDGSNNLEAAEQIALIPQIVKKVVVIRGQAEQYSGQVQQDIIAIEQSVHEGPNGATVAGVENGVVTASYTPGEEAAGTGIMEALEGESLEIIVKDAGGWAYCRRQGHETPGWLPSTRVAELAALTADHVGQDRDGLLNLKKGDMVEVINRHYSGWTYCREWSWPPLPGVSSERKEGWVTDTYLEDRRSQAMLASKWHRLILQALEQVVASARELELVLQEAESILAGVQGPIDPNSEWLARCLEFAAWLSAELGNIASAVQQQKGSTIVEGCRATAKCDAESTDPNQLTCKEGDTFVVIDAKHADWVWCRAVGSDDREGWVLRGNLVFDEPNPSDDDSASESEKQRSTLADLPDWVRVGERCKWWSASGNRFCDVIIQKVDESKQEVRVIFVADESCWKVVSFSHFELPAVQWMLQPLVDKERELRESLPKWVSVGHSASWWSVSQKRCMPVNIHEVSFRRRMVGAAFAQDPSVQKFLPFHELIDGPETCLLQEDSKGHEWRTKTLDAGKRPRPLDDNTLAFEAPSQRASPMFGGGGDDQVRREESNKLMTTKMGDLMFEMQQVLGDLLGPEGGIDLAGAAEAADNEVEFVAEPAGGGPAGSAIADPVDVASLLAAVEADMSSASAAEAAATTPARQLSKAGKQQFPETPASQDSLGSLASLASLDPVKEDAKLSAAPEAIAPPSVEGQSVDAGSLPVSGDNAGPTPTQQGSLSTTLLAAGPPAGKSADSPTREPKEPLGSQASVPEPSSHLAADETGAAAHPAEQDRPPSQGASRPPSRAQKDPPALQASFQELASQPSAQEPGGADQVAEQGTPLSQADRGASLLESQSLQAPVRESAIQLADEEPSGTGQAPEPGRPLSQEDHLASRPPSQAAPRASLSPSQAALQAERPLSQAARLQSALEHMEQAGPPKTEPQLGGPVTPQANSVAATPVEAAGLPAEAAAAAHQAAVTLEELAPTDAQLYLQPQEQPPDAWAAEDLSATSLDLAERELTFEPSLSQLQDELQAQQPETSVEDGTSASSLELAEREFALAPSESQPQMQAQAQPLETSVADGTSASSLELAERELADVEASLSGLGVADGTVGSGSAPLVGLSGDGGGARGAGTELAAVPEDHSVRDTPDLDPKPLSAIIDCTGMQPERITCTKSEEALEKEILNLDSESLRESLGLTQLMKDLDVPESPNCASDRQRSLAEMAVKAHEREGGDGEQLSVVDQQLCSANDGMWECPTESAEPSAAQPDSTGARSSAAASRSGSVPDVASVDVAASAVGAHIRMQVDHPHQDVQAPQELGTQEEDLGGMQNCSELLRQAVSLIQPSTWDADPNGEGEGRQPVPDVEQLAMEWPRLEEELTTAVEVEDQKVEVYVEQKLQRRVYAVDTHLEDLQRRLEERAQSAEQKLNPQEAHRYRTMSWEVVQMAEAARDQRTKNKEALLALRPQKAAHRREALREALGMKDFGGKGLDMPMLDRAALADLSVADAVTEVAEIAGNLFRSLQVAVKSRGHGRSCQPQAQQSRQGWASGSQPGGLAGTQRSKQDSVQRELESKCEAALESLDNTLNALKWKLEQEQNKGVSGPSVELAAVARGEEGLSREQKREKAMFEGQQDYDWERSHSIHVEEHAARMEKAFAATLAQAEQTLRGRWRTKTDRDRAMSFHRLDQLVEHMDKADAEKKSIALQWRERAEEDAAKLEAERRRIQEQMEVLVSAAAVIRQEKAKMNEVYYAPKKEKQEIMIKCLRRVRRLNQDLKDFNIAPEMKQQHSVLLYSLRMLEARLVAECPHGENKIEDGDLETPELKKERVEAQQAFEDQLVRDLESLHASYKRRAEREAAQGAARCRVEAERELGDAVPAARVALEESLLEGALAEIALCALTPFAEAAAGLETEALRHSEVEGSAFEPASFGPKRKRLGNAIRETLVVIKKSLKALGEARATLHSDGVPKPEDGEWARKVDSVTERWKAFCEAHPASDAADAGGMDTPRVLEGAEHTAALQNLQVDDLEGGATPRDLSNAPTGGPTEERTSQGGQMGQRTNQGVPTQQRMAPARKSTAQGTPSPRAEKGQGTPSPRADKDFRETRATTQPKARAGNRASSVVPGRTGRRGSDASTRSTGAPAAGPPGGRGPSAGGAPAKGGAGGKASQLLAQLDELSSRMDNTLGGHSRVGKPGANNASGRAPAPPPPRKGLTAPSARLPPARGKPRS